MSKEFDYQVKIPVCKPYFGGNEVKYTNDCVKSGWISSLGPYVKKFEQLFAMWLYSPDDYSNGKGYAVSVTSATTALEIALHTLKIGKNYGGKETDEVIIPDFTMIAVPNCVYWAGAKVVLCDVDYGTFGLDPEKIRELITPNTKAVIVTHTYGIPDRMDKIVELCHKYDLKLIEDCAEGLGATFKDEKVGTFGDISIFSFYANKVITTGEGGMVCTRNPDYAKRAFYLKEHTFDDTNHFWHKEVGHNYRLTALQAAVGLAQLEEIQDHIERKRKIAMKYDDILRPEFDKFNNKPTDKDMDLVMDNYLTMPLIEGSVYWMWGVRVPFKDLMRMKLAQEGIETRSYFIPIHQQKPYMVNGDFYYSHRLYLDGFYLPSSVDLKDSEIEFVCKKLLKFIKEARGK